MTANLTIALLGLAIILIIVNGYGKPLTETRYIMNTYAYILFAILAISGTVLYIDNHHQEIAITAYMNFFVMFILLITTLFATIAISPENYIIKHIAWLAFLAIVGIMIYPSAKLALIKGQLWNIIISLACIVGTLSFIAYTKPLGTYLSWGNMLTTCLVGLIIFEVVDMLFFADNNTNKFITRTKIYSWITIILFSGFMLYDTQKLILHAKIYNSKCSNTINLQQLSCVDYPSESLSLFLDIINLFSSMSNIS